MRLQKLYALLVLFFVVNSSSIAHTLSQTSDSLNVIDTVRVEKRYANGNLKVQYEFLVTADHLYLMHGKINRYYSNGQLRLTGNNEHGLGHGWFRWYRKNGEVRREKELHKGIYLSHKKTNYSPEEFENNPLSELVKYKSIQLKNGKSKKKVKQSYLISVKLKNEKEKRRHLRVEGFTDNAMIVSGFSYDRSESYTLSLAYDSSYVIPFDDITFIEAASKNSGNKADMGIAWRASSPLFFVGGIVLLAATSSSGASILAISYFGLGTSSIFFGKSLERKSIHHQYELSDWQITNK